MRLEELKRGMLVAGVSYEGAVTLKDVELGEDSAEVVFRDASGKLGDQVLYREDEPGLSVVRGDGGWRFDGDGARFRLAAEARRIGSAYLFDPMLAVHTSLVDPYPHQISAVYERMLGKQPLRFLLADDPGAGKTIMAGLLIKELIARGDLARCMIVCPGSLVEQWQDELQSKFGLRFKIVARGEIEASATGDPFSEEPFVICRLDHLSRNDEVKDVLRETEWDLIVSDEAHKMSASFSGNEVKATKRYQLGELLSGITRHFLLMSATPHNGKEEDFQLFMRLLDPDRFQRYFRFGKAGKVDTQDVMRRMTKEDLKKFDGTDLFPPREAHTVGFTMAAPEYDLYEAVTDYVRNEFNRAEAAADGRKRTVGFALTVLQRRLASSPEAIYLSLKRRRERLEAKLKEAKKVGKVVRDDGLESLVSKVEDFDDVTDTDREVQELEDAGQFEEAEEEVADLATAATTIYELEAEILTLKSLEEKACKLRSGNQDRKWRELRKLLESSLIDAANTETESLSDNTRLSKNAYRRFRRQGKTPSFEKAASKNRDRERPEDEVDFSSHPPRKLIIFTEHKDTLNYLERKVSAIQGDDSLVRITGGMNRQARKTAQERFLNDPKTRILLATDAAGEGVNLQRASLMVNYDLPWNPNRLEQRFGRIHRIGQTERCHVWNLVADDTREGEVYHRLLEKLEVARKALGGKVFDVLGEMFRDHSLSDLLMAAVREGKKGDVRRGIMDSLDHITQTEHLHRLVRDQALTHEAMNPEVLGNLRAEMERADARRLQPYFIASFFLEVVRLFGGNPTEPERGRYNLKKLPDVIHARARRLPGGRSISSTYERVTFEKSLRSVQGKAPASFFYPGHPVVDAAGLLVLERCGDSLSRGAVLVDKDDTSTEVRVLALLEHTIRDGRRNSQGENFVAGRRMQFVEVTVSGEARNVGYAPHLDYRPISDEEKRVLNSLGSIPQDVAEKAKAYATNTLAREHLDEVRREREERVEKVRRLVRERLTSEVGYWDSRIGELYDVVTSRPEVKVNIRDFERRRNDLSRRMERRMTELDLETQLVAAPPIVIGAALIIPGGLLLEHGLLTEEDPSEIPEVFTSPPNAAARKRVEDAAMQAVIMAELDLGNDPKDVSRENRGYDVESQDRATGRLRMIEVKGRAEGATTVTVTRNETLTALNRPDDFILALVSVSSDYSAAGPRYVRRPFGREMGFTEVSVNHDLKKLLDRSESPS